MGRWRQLFLALVVLAIISGSSFTAGVTAERGGLVPGALHVEPPELVSQFSVFWQAWGLVQEHFVDRQAVDPRTMTYGAIDGMLSSLGDPGHTRFVPPDRANILSSDFAGEFQGIGAELGQKDGILIVVAPLDGSPAQKAGIQAGDALLAVNGQQVAGMSLDQVVQMVRGPEGSKVTLTVIHPNGMSTTDITIVRARIEMHPVSWAMVPGTKIAHLRISQFSANTNRDLLAALKELRAAGAQGMVVDLRSNTGGLLDQCISVTSQFLSGGNVLQEQDAQGNRKVQAVQPGGQATDLPMVVLINRGTASAAEIFAGAMQDNQRAKLVGETTFGTGTVLTYYQLSDGSALLLGTGEWLTPNGRQIWKHGIEPDFAVPTTADSTILSPKNETDMTSDQFRAANDTQLMKALEQLGQKP